MEILTKNTNLELNFRLNLKIDKNKLLNKCKSIVQKFALKNHFGPYHSEGWNSISLVSAYGEVYQSEKVIGNYKKNWSLTYRTIHKWFNR